ncbi:MAG: TonB-dependent receptor [Bryobacteraceae bacterium]
MLLRYLLVVSLLCTAGFAQSNASDGAIDGFVQDESGAFLSGAKVTVRNIHTNVETEALTNGSGYYRMPLLRIGEYEVKAQAAGFADFTQSGIQLSVGKQARVNVTLKVGQVSDSVTVTADAGIVEVGAAPTIEEVVNEKAVRSLPITSRNVYNFHLLGPGVKGIPSTGFGTTQFTFGGHNRSAWSVDGLDNTQRRFNRQIRLVISTPESVQEMQVISGAYSAEFGRAAGGVINVISRSGTNDLHFGGMWLYRPRQTAARPPLAATKPNQKWWMIGGNAAGALSKDRLWFFINDEYNPLKVPQPVTINPDVARILQISLPISATRRSARPSHLSAKLNFRLSDRNSGFIRYNRFTNDQPGGGGGLTTIGRSTTFEDRMNGGAAQFTTVISPTVLNEIRFGINRRAETRLPVGQIQPGSAAVNISGTANFGVNPLAGSASVETSTQIIDNLTWTRGNTQ